MTGKSGIDLRPGARPVVPRFGEVQAGCDLFACNLPVGVCRSRSRCMRCRQTPIAQAELMPQPRPDVLRRLPVQCDFLRTGIPPP